MKVAVGVLISRFAINGIAVDDDYGQRFPAYEAGSGRVSNVNYGGSMAGTAVTNQERSSLKKILSQIFFYGRTLSKMYLQHILSELN